MVPSNIKEPFFSLVRLGIGHQSGYPIPNQVDWNELEALAAEQGLSAVVVDGVDRLPLEARPPKLVLLQWIGETLQGYEYRYELYCRTIAEMAAFYNEHGFKMMVLKGYACSLDWSKPEHRPCGDIDIWLFGQQKEADAALAASSKFQDSGSKIDRSHHHHTVFEWRDFMVENHYDFVNVYAHKSSRELEKIFKELGNLKVECSEFRAEGQLKECSDAGCKFPVVEVYGEKVYLPSPNLHALFLIKHMVSHFAAANITLRQVLDWAFFVKVHTKEIDWKWLIELLEKYHMKDFYCCLNAICVEDLGFPVNMFPSVQFEPRLKEKVLEDVLLTGFKESPPKGFIPRVFFKYRRWKANEWKHKICYKESMWESFWSGVWNHLLKPSSI